MHPFYVIKNASRNRIIGCDFLKQQKARIYFDLEKLRLNDEYIILDQDIHVASVVRLAHDVTIPPQTSVRVSGKLKTRAYYEPGFICQVNQGARSCIRNEPGLLLANSLSKLDNRCRFSEVQVSADYRQGVTDILKKNADVFAACDTDFGLTNKVTMTIDTGKHPPIKQRPYRTLLTKMQTVDEAVDKMLKADVIEESTGSWAFPIVIVDKKDGSKRFYVDYRCHKTDSVPFTIY
ncbi:retrovirus-related pol polyprotein from transposon [Plakobranchus ocellatus]|uniref:Retrovirus-related pol polyprotein from transposon n=1 Tax=Plakobranchus ocellatus TaxID=259542 RepID=A0AAV3WVQ2_9GAST|nr:retrovirus-related pol polyprotein from transposon [Plakobranchus ocellatus]